ncbi:hypothetical protein V8E51_012865 [Hyaloscypha variabilis]
MPPHGPGPQPPSDGRPFFLVLTIAVKDAASTEELGEILKGQKDWSLAQGAKSFSIGRNRYNDVDGFHGVHSPPQKTAEYIATRERIMELEGKISVTFFHIIDF